MSSNETFEAALIEGTEAEDTVYNWLKRNYSYVQDTRYQTRDKGTGPRLVGTEKSVILPDFIIYDRFKGKWAIDVKKKSAAYIIGGRRCFTVDEYKYRDYMKCVELLGLDGLMILFMFDDNLYVYKHTDMVSKHAFSNEHGNTACLFEFDKSKIRYL